MTAEKASIASHPSLEFFKAASLSSQFNLEPKHIKRVSPSKLDLEPFQNFTILDPKKASLMLCHLFMCKQWRLTFCVFP